MKRAISNFLGTAVIVLTMPATAFAVLWLSPQSQDEMDGLIKNDIVDLARSSGLTNEQTERLVTTAARWFFLAQCRGSVDSLPNGQAGHDDASRLIHIDRFSKEGAFALAVEGDLVIRHADDPGDLACSFSRTRGWFR